MKKFKTICAEDLIRRVKNSGFDFIEIAPDSAEERYTFIIDSARIRVPFGCDVPYVVFKMLGEERFLKLFPESSEFALIDDCGNYFVVVD